MNLPGSLAWFGELDVSLPDRAGDLGRHERLDRRSGDQGLDGVQRNPLHLLLASSAFRISGCAAGILLTGEPGSFASLITPAYSEWSVTPAQSSGVSIFTS